MAGGGGVTCDWRVGSGRGVALGGAVGVALGVWLGMFAVPVKEVGGVLSADSTVGSS